MDQKFLLLAPLRVILAGLQSKMINLHNFYLLQHSEGPKAVFLELLNLSEQDDKSWDLLPKKYTILNSPSEPLDLQSAYNFISEGDFSLRKNYAGCLFLQDNFYLFFMLKKGYEYTYE